MRKFLVVGGAGFIGSHMVKLLLATGQSVVTVDDFSAGHRNAIIGGDIIEGSIGDPLLLRKVFSDHKFDGVIHLASCIRVDESRNAPAKYYVNNLANTLALAIAMVEAEVRVLVFSSTAAIYGNPQSIPISETHPKQPINPYGRSKWMVEQVLEDFDRAYGLKSVCLRYFNAAGADPAGQLGECHDPETHLIPLALQVASGKREVLPVFGRDYDTPDGTCIRDYVHVNDLCQAHMLAMNKLCNEGNSAAYNLGNGAGFSVQQVIQAIKEVTGKPVRVRDSPRRAGDPAVLLADSRRARSELGWVPEFSSLETMIEHAWRWEQKVAGAGLAS
jgi:UDP-glucose 4-epimerase